MDGLERPELLIADKFKHRASTLFALTEVPEEKRHAFYKHMGHSQQINRDVYQCPLAVKEVTQVGKFLDTLDHETSETHTHMRPLKPTQMRLKVQKVVMTGQNCQQLMFLKKMLAQISVPKTTWRWLLQRKILQLMQPNQQKQGAMFSGKSMSMSL